MTMTDIERLKNLASNLNLEETIQIVDIGANPIGGDAPYQKLLDADLCHVTGFEPQLNAYNELLKLKGPSETYHQLAVGDGNRHNLFVYNASGFTSLYPLNNDTWRAIGLPDNWRNLRQKIEMDTVRLDNIDEIDQIDFLKIDIQGGELAVFSNARHKMRNTIAIQTEVRFLQLYDYEPDLSETSSELIKQGFEIHKLVSNHRFYHTSSQVSKLHRRAKSQMIDGDMIYARNLRQLSKYTPLELKKLAVMADGIFGSFDLALACIDCLADIGACPTDFAENYFETIPDFFKADQQ